MFPVVDDQEATGEQSTIYIEGVTEEAARDTFAYNSYEFALHCCSDLWPFLAKEESEVVTSHKKEQGQTQKKKGRIEN